MLVDVVGVDGVVCVVVGDEYVVVVVMVVMVVVVVVVVVVVLVARRCTSSIWPHVKRIWAFLLSLAVVAD